NADHIRLLPEAELAERLIPYLQAGGVLGDQVTEEQRALVAAATPLVQTRMNLLGEAPALMGFLFIADADLVVQDDALKKLGDEPVAVLDRTLRELEALPEGAFTAAALEEALRGAIIDEMGIKPRLAFGPLRSAISGRRVSPPLFESMELLGRASSLTRLRSLRDGLAAPDCADGRCGAACAVSQRSGPFSLCLGGEDQVESYLGTAGKFGPERPRNPPRSNPGRTEKRALTMGYGVIGNTTVSGTVILGSSPGTPALHSFSGSVQSAPRSSSGPGRRPLTAVTPVQIRYGVRVEIDRSRSGPVRLAAQDAALSRR